MVKSKGGYLSHFGRLALAVGSLPPTSVLHRRANVKSIRKDTLQPGFVAVGCLEVGPIV
jgi:hypothetical protein